MEQIGSGAAPLQGAAPDFFTQNRLSTRPASFVSCACAFLFAGMPSTNTSDPRRTAIYANGGPPETADGDHRASSAPSILIGLSAVLPSPMAVS